MLRLAAFGLAALAVAASAEATPIDISGAVNSNLYTFTGGTTYPPAGSKVTITGAQGPIDFVLANFYPASFAAPDVGVVLTGDGSPTSVTIDTPDLAITRPTTFYSLLNSGFGVLGQTIGNLTLNFAIGPSYVYVLTEGLNIRDHYNGFFNNTATGVYGTAAYNGGDDRLDAQQIVLPSLYIGDTLTSITLNNTNEPGGNPFLTAFSAVGGVPEPAAWMTMVLGLGVIGTVMRGRRPLAGAA